MGTFSITNVETLREDLHKGAVTVEFTKVNGEHRVMVCTLNSKLITEAQNLDPSLVPDSKAFENAVKSSRNSNTQRVWEIHTGWRSFKLNSVISITPVVPFV